MKLHSPRQRNQATKVYLGVGIALSLFLAMVLWLPMPDVAVEAGHTVARPVWNVRNSLTATFYRSYAALTSKQALVDENIRLHDELSRLRRETFATNVLKEENKQLRGLLGRSSKNEETIAAGVLAGPGAAPYDTIIIDAGSREGVSEGDLVVVEGNVVLGTVERALAHTSVVSLFSTPGRQTPVVIGSGSTTPAIAEGRGAGNFVMQLPRDIEVKEGDPIILPLLSPILFATVERVVSDSNDAFKKILFKNPINISSVRFVIVRSGASSREAAELLKLPSE